jgi:hypothetical protein
MSTTNTNQQAVSFAQMGFASTVTAASATPAADGYYGTFCGLPYHIDPNATSESYAALMSAIAEDLVTVEPYVAITAPAPTPGQLATNALATGLTLTSADTPALNAVYACDQLSQMDIIAIETSLNAGKGFPGGAITFNYPDSSGAMHAFTEAKFADFAAAVRDFVYGCKSVIAGQSTALPASEASIA